MPLSIRLFKHQISLPPVLILLILALVVRLFIFFYILNLQPDKFKLQDLDGYINIASNLINYGIYSRESAPPYILDITRPPVYPIVLAGLMLSGDFNGNLIVLFQLILGTALVGVTYVLSRELIVASNFALIAALFVAVNPMLIFIDHYPLSETLFILLWISGLWLFAKYCNSQKIICLLSSSLLLALATLTRPILQFFPLYICLIIFLITGQKLTIRFRDSILFLLFFLGLIIPWGMRNKNVGGIFTLSPISEINLYYYRAKAVLADVENISQGEALERLNDKLSQAVSNQGLTTDQVYPYMRSRAIEILIAHPFPTLKMTAIGAARLLLDPGYSLVCTSLDPGNLTSECFAGDASMLGESIFMLMGSRFITMNPLQKITLMWSILLMVGLYMGAGVASIILFRQKKWLTLSITLGGILYFVLLSSGAESLYRLRAPIIPLLAILTAIALMEWKHKSINH